MNNEKTIKKYLNIILLVVSSFNLIAQTEKHQDSSYETERFHSITFVMANAFVPNSFSENTDNILIVPIYGINYDFQINMSWGVGFHTDIILQQFKVEKHSDSEEIIRENPVSMAAILFFKPHHQWKIIGGYGVELEKNENFQLIRVGLEYAISLPKNWELGFMLENDFKINGYYSLALGIGFTKKVIKKFN